MEKPPSIKKADLARHWGVTPAYVTQLFKRHEKKTGERVEFATLEAADAWRAINAPPRPVNQMRRENAQSLEKNGVESAEKIANFPNTTNSNSPAPTTPGMQHAAASLPANVELENESCIKRGGDYDALAAQSAEDVLRLADGYIRRAYAAGSAAEVFAAIKNYNEAAKVAASARGRFFEVQEKTRALIPLDLVMDIVGTEHHAIRSLLLQMGKRYGAKANPANPEIGVKVIEDAVDEVLRAMTLAADRVEKGAMSPAVP